jgi:hypothetical protein
MRKLRIIIVLMLLASQSNFAQKASNSNKEIPLFNYVTNCQLRYYYFPNLEAYFDTQKSIYYFKENGKWVTADEIPEGYRGYSLYNKVNVFITDYDDENPCQFIEIHRKKYPYIANEKGKPLTYSNQSP